jgi:hypothetical protein
MIKSHKISIEELQENWIKDITIGSGLGANGTPKRLIFFVFPTHPEDSYYQIFDEGRSEILKYNNLKDALYIYNLI